MPGKAEAAVLERLFGVIESREDSKPESSYTAQLMAAGPERIAAKLEEEAREVAEAALRETPERIAAESADLLYHLLVLWAARGVKPADVWAELTRRGGVSGLTEKAARDAKKPTTGP